MSFPGRSEPELTDSAYNKEAQLQMKMARSAASHLLYAPTTNPSTFDKGVEAAITVLQRPIKIKKTGNKLYQSIAQLVDMLYEQKNGLRTTDPIDEDKFIQFLNRLVTEHAISFSTNQVDSMREVIAGDLHRGEERVKQILETKERTRPKGVPDRLRYAEAVLRNRTNRIALVLESPYDMHNVYAVLRTAECFGIQYVYIVINKETKNMHSTGHSISKGNDAFLTIKRFNTTAECIQALREDKREIWATDLSADAIVLGSEISKVQVPERVAIVMGRETDGISQEMMKAADRRVYIPLVGFTESLNMSVAAALMMQYLLLACPEARGNLTEEEKKTIRKEWYEKLATSEELRQTYMTYLDNPPSPVTEFRRTHKEVFVNKKIRKKLQQRELNSNTDSKSGEESGEQSMKDGSEPPPKRAKLDQEPQTASEHS